MRRTNGFAGAALSLLFCITGTTVVVLAQGNLDPPPEAFSGNQPISTMKSLNQVEPRSLIASLPFSITNSGSYYITGNLRGTDGSNGIYIAAGNVQLDLNGFALIGSTNTGMGADNLTLNGILIEDSPELKNVTIQNGVVHNWGRCGIRSILAQDCKAVGVTASRNGNTNGYDGMELGAGWLVSDCLAARNGGDGISSTGRCTARRTEVRSNERHGFNLAGDSLVTDCSALWNNMDGISAGSYSVVRNCSVNGNGSNGITVVDACVVVDNHCSGNGGPGEGAGIFAANYCRIENNHLNHNKYGVRTAGSSTKSLVIRNSAVMSGITDYDMSSGTHYGAILSNQALGAGFTNANPWANFSQ